MSTLYILGGPPRTAKTTIMTNLAVEKRIANISSDAINHGIRNLLTGKPHQMLRRIELHGQAEHKTSISQGGDMVLFSKEGLEAEFMLEAVVGMLDYYRKNGSSVAFEGTAFTPEWVSRLSPEGFVVRAAFVGYTSSAHADNVIAYAKEHSEDWINVWLKGEKGNEEPIRKWIAQEVDQCKSLKERAESLGYPFFDISILPYAEYIDSVQRSLLGS